MVLPIVLPPCPPCPPCDPPCPPGPPDPPDPCVFGGGFGGIPLPPCEWFGGGGVYDPAPFHGGSPPPPPADPIMLAPLDPGGVHPYGPNIDPPLLCDVAPGNALLPYPGRDIPALCWLLWGNDADDCPPVNILLPVGNGVLHCGWCPIIVGSTPSGTIGVPVCWRRCRCSTESLKCTCFGRIVPPT